MVLRWLLRVLFIVFACSFVLQANEIAMTPTEMEFTAWIYLLIAFLVSSGVVLFEILFQKEAAREMVAVAFGLFAGLFTSAIVVQLLIVFLLPTSDGYGHAFERLQTVIPILTLSLCYVGVSLILQTKGDFRFLVPYIDFSQRGQQEGGLVLDTSVIVDGRIHDIVETHIINTPLVIPDFVIGELQKLADSADGLKRKRGRRGLDILAKLQKSETGLVQLRETELPDDVDVDAGLLQIAKEINGRIMTNDFNLNKVSQIEGIQVVNVNELANALKPQVLPGERIQVKIIRPGDEAGQGVGYLDDGTMVVVENGRDLIGQVADLMVTGAIQTSAGRMVFGRPGGEDGNGHDDPRRRGGHSHGARSARPRPR